MMYAHADRSFHLSPGDSLLFDAEAIHGPEELIQLPSIFIRYGVRQARQVVTE